MMYRGKIVTPDFLTEILGYKKINQSNYCDIYTNGEIKITFMHSGEVILGHGYNSIKTYPDGKLKYDVLHYFELTLTI